LAPRSVWMGAGNLVATGIQSPDRPTRSELLYRLSYPDTLEAKIKLNYTVFKGPFRTAQ